jgi:hypothetical protein
MTMQDSNLRVVNLDLLPPYIDALMPDQLFEEFRANIHRSTVLKNMGEAILTEAQGKAIEEWLFDQIDALELGLGFHLGVLEWFVRGIEHEDLSLQLKNPI